MTKSKKAKPASNPNLAAITVRTDNPESQAARFEALAICAISPEVSAAQTVRAYASIPKDELAMDAILTELVKECSADTPMLLTKGERMLVAQAHALDTIFSECALRARRNMGEYTKTAELYLRVGLRAQSQCRATWETLATLRNPPPTTFVRQANIAAGPQQVNNGSPPAHAEESSIAPNKLLEDADGKRLDNRAAIAASQTHPAMAPVGAINRAED